MKTYLDTIFQIQLFQIYFILSTNYATTEMELDPEFRCRKEGNYADQRATLANNFRIVPTVRCHASGPKSIEIISSIVTNHKTTRNTQEKNTTCL